MIIPIKLIKTSFHAVTFCVYACGVKVKVSGYDSLRPQVPGILQTRILALEIYSLSTFPIFNTVLFLLLLIIVIMFYIKSELTCISFSFA